MAINLTKGQNAKLPGLTTIRAHLGWTPRETAGQKFDLDAICFMVGSDGKVRSDKDFIFYGQLTYKPCVLHSPDDLEGFVGEVVDVDLTKVPVDVEKLVFIVTIYDWKGRKQNFGMVSNPYIRILEIDGIWADSEYEKKTGLWANPKKATVKEEIARFDLAEDAADSTSMIFGEVYRYNGEWKFRAIGQGYNNEGLYEMCKRFGVKGVSAPEGASA